MFFEKFPVKIVLGPWKIDLLWSLECSSAGVILLGLFLQRFNSSILCDFRSMKTPPSSRHTEASIRLMYCAKSAEDRL